MVGVRSGVRWWRADGGGWIVVEDGGNGRVVRVVESGWLGWWSGGMVGDGGGEGWWKKNKFDEKQLMSEKSDSTLK